MRLQMATVRRNFKAQKDAVSYTDATDNSCEGHTGLDGTPFDHRAELASTMGSVTPYSP
jgi:hypothetical protein